MCPGVAEHGVLAVPTVEPTEDQAQAAVEEEAAGHHRGVRVPDMATVAGRCPAANRMAQRMLTTKKTPWGISSLLQFLKNSFQMRNAARDIRNRRSSTSSMIPP